MYKHVFILYRATVPSGPSLLLRNSETMIFMGGISMEHTPYIGGEDRVTANTTLRWSSLDTFMESIYYSFLKHRKKQKPCYLYNFKN